MPLEENWRSRCAHAVYDVGAALATLVCIPLWPWLRRRLGGHVGERLGRLPDTFRAVRSAPFWIHAASVGEVLAAAPLVSALRHQRPGVPIVVSTTTVTGRSVALRDLRADAVTLLPIDAWGIVDRAFCRVRPRSLFIMETEIWPGLLRAADRVGANVMLVSGRISERTLRRCRLAGPLFPAAVRRIAVLCMQTEEDAKRIMALGAPAERVHVTGSLKGSRDPESFAPQAIGGLRSRPVLIAASTQPGEEEFVLAACRPLWAEFPDLLLIVAPRRPERFAEVERLVMREGLRYRRRTIMGDHLSPETQLLLLDTVGELPRFFPAATAVFVGGTVAPLGGHNVLEPATYAKPIAFGPHTRNVAAAAEALLVAGGGDRVHEPIDLERRWREFLVDQTSSVHAGRQARGVAEAQSMVLERTWAHLEPFLGDVA